MPRNSSETSPDDTPSRLPRVPEAFGGVQVNFCKNPSCANFGVPVSPIGGRGKFAENGYTVVAAGKGFPIARCNSCGEHFPFKSNRGIYEEFWRIYRQTHPVASCPEALCDHHRIPVDTPGAYQAFGQTTIGSKRYRCKRCGRTFSVKPSGLNPIAKQLRSDKNPTIFRMLTGKMPLRRICEAADVAPRVLYERIDFFYEQCLAFLADRERRLPTLDIKRLYIGVDRQDYAINWFQRKDKRNVILSAVSSADNGTGYVFGMHPNFDPECDPTQIEATALACGDSGLPGAHRRFGRLWLASDYAAAVAETQKRNVKGSLAEEIAGAYDDALRRTDIESPEQITGTETLPAIGMQVHSEYTLYGHFLHLLTLFDSVEKVRFFLDQDSGMRAACLGAFAGRIKDRRCDAFYVRIAKNLTVDEKRRLVRDAESDFRDLAKRHSGMSEEEVSLLLLKQRIAQSQQIGKWKDRWVTHPRPTMSEPEKAMCFLTDMGDYDEDHLAWLYNKASLHAVDSWFNRLRRRSSMLERPVSSAGNRGRVWSGYSAYRPEQIGKLMTIFRACHNYLWVGEGKEVRQKGTPAMRLGLAKAPLDYTDIIYFR